MQLRVLQINTIQNKFNQHKSENNSNSNLNNDYVSTVKNFSKAQETYGRYLAFKGAASSVTERVNVLKNFLDNEVAAFLTKHANSYEENKKINQSSNDTFDYYWQKRTEFSMKLSNLSALEKIDFIAKNLGRFFKYEKNVQEYNYLQEKSKKYFASTSSREYAETIRPEIQSMPDFLRIVKPFMDRYKKVKMDISNGFANVNPFYSLDPLIKAKAIASTEAERLSSDNIECYIRIADFKDNVTKLLTHPEVEQNKDALDSYYKKIEKIKELMCMQEDKTEHIETTTMLAKGYMEKSLLTTQEIDEAFQKLEQGRLKVLNRNVAKLKRYLNDHPEFLWKQEFNASTDAFLKKQHQLNGRLWKRIENDKKNHFDPTKKSNDNISNDFNPSKQGGTEIAEDDIPF